MVVKRIVFVHRNGLHQICGVVDKLPPAFFARELWLGVECASLVRESPRAGYYRERLETVSDIFGAARE